MLTQPLSPRCPPHHPLGRAARPAARPSLCARGLEASLSPIHAAPPHASSLGRRATGRATPKLPPSAGEQLRRVAAAAEMLRPARGDAAPRARLPPPSAAAAARLSLGLGPWRAAPAKVRRSDYLILPARVYGWLLSAVQNLPTPRCLDLLNFAICCLKL